MNAAAYLTELVKFPTQQAGADGKSGNERAICEYLVTELKKHAPDEITLGTAPRTEGGDGAFVFARWGTPKRVVNAHVDTVPANAGWSRDPWQPHVEHGRLYGLGSADTKGAIAATLVALANAKRRPSDVGVLFSGDEEAGCGVMRVFLSSSHIAGIREVLVCEPTARRAGIAHRGVLAQTATLHGPGGHSSKADFLPKPLVQLARLATELDALGKRRLPEGPPGMTGTCLNIADLRGGVAFNVIPAKGELEWSLRPYPGFDRARWDAEVTELARAVDPGIAITTSQALDLVPFSCDALSEFARPFVREIGPLDFWTEAAMWMTAGIDAIVIGPGDIAQAHAADEFVELADLDWFTELVAAWLGFA